MQLSVQFAKSLIDWTLRYQLGAFRKVGLARLSSLDDVEFRASYRNRKPFVIRPSIDLRKDTADHLIRIYERYANDKGVLPHELGSLLVHREDPTRRDSFIDQDCHHFSVTIEQIRQFFSQGDQRSDEVFHFRGQMIDEFSDLWSGLPHFITQSEGAANRNCNLWFANAGSRTAAHRDPWHGFLLHLYGTKRIVLAPPFYVNDMYLRDSESLGAGTRGDRSVPSVNFLEPDLEKHPRFRNVQRIDVTLNPGDMVYIPPFWFHDVECLTSSISLSARLMLSLDEHLHPIRIDNFVHRQPMAW